jgi:hypothetical protein
MHRHSCHIKSRAGEILVETQRQPKTSASRRLCLFLHGGRTPTRPRRWKIAAAALIWLLMIEVLIIAQAVLCTTPVWAAARQPSPGATNPVDINAASIGDLRTRLKITEADARQIVRGRPYHSRDEVLRKKVISKATYEKIRKQIIPNR